MSNVSFNEDENGGGTGSLLYSRLQRSNQPPGMVRWLMRMGVKSEPSANFVLLGIVLLVIAGIFLTYHFFIAPPPHDTSSVPRGPALREIMLKQP